MIVNPQEKLYKIFSNNLHQNLLTDVNNNLSFTYGSFYQCAVAYAKELKNTYSLKSGDKIIIVMGNKAETLLMRFASLFLGTICVPVNPGFSDSDLLHILDVIDFKLIITDEDRVSNILNKGSYPKDSLYLYTKTIEQEEFYTDIVSGNTIFPDYESFLPNIAADSIIDVMFTSGSTGTPKALPIQFDKIISNGLAFIEHHDFPKQKTFYNVLPVCYLGGWYNLFLIPILNESHVILDAPFGGKNMFSFWKNIVKFNISIIWFSPTILAMLLEIKSHSDPEVIKCAAQVIDYALVGMAPLNKELRTKFTEHSSLRLLENYALSETFFISSQVKNDIEDDTCGGILSHIEVKAMDQMKIQSSELIVKSPYMIDDYYFKVDDIFTSDNFFLTGDLGEITKDNKIKITGRKKDIIIKGGINIDPREIENAIYKLPSVHEVTVIGIPDDIYGEVICAVVSADDQVTEKDIKNFCKSLLAREKTPQKVLKLDRLPKNSSGKIDKLRIKEIILTI